MNKIVTSIIISLILVIIVPTVLADSSISISTDKTLYDRADTIVISGQITEAVENTSMTIQILNGGNLIEISQLIITQDGIFTHTILADGAQWTNPGTYTIRASTTEENAVETTFDFITPSMVEQIAEAVEEPQPDPLPHLESQPEAVFEGEPEQKPIPEWVKTVFAFWADNQISDQELKNAIKFLVQNGIIIL